MTSRYLKRLYEIAPYITELRGPNTPPRTGVVGVDAPARERRASNAQNRQIRRQRRTQGGFDPDTLNQGTEIKMNRYMQTLLEAARLAVRKEFRIEDPTGFSGPIAQQYGRRRSSRGIRDRRVRAAARAAKKRMEKKLRVKPGSTKPQAQHMVQAAMLHRKKKHKEGLPPERPQDAKADAQRDEWRKRAPGDK